MLFVSFLYFLGIINNIEYRGDCMAKIIQFKEVKQRKKTENSKKDTTTRESTNKMEYSYNYLLMSFMVIFVVTFILR